MNPFLESTVARPLSGCRRSLSWCSGAGRQLSSSEQRIIDISAEADNEPGSPAAISADDAEKPMVRKSRYSVKATLRAAALGVGLALPMVLSTWTSPVGLAGSALVLGVMFPAAVQAVDVNRATIQELRTIKGIGPKTAQQIVDERARGGAYESISDLSDRVKGIGPKKAAALAASGLAVQSASTGNTTKPGPLPVPASRAAQTVRR